MRATIQHVIFQIFIFFNVYFTHIVKAKFIIKSLKHLPGKRMC